MKKINTNQFGKTRTRKNRQKPAELPKSALITLHVIDGGGTFVPSKMFIKPYRNVQNNRNVPPMQVDTGLSAGEKWSNPREISAMEKTMFVVVPPCTLLQHIREE